MIYVGYFLCGVVEIKWPLTKKPYKIEMGLGCVYYFAEKSCFDYKIISMA